MLRPQPAIGLLTTYEERAELLAEQGVDVVIEEPFVREFSTRGYEEFFVDHLVRALNVQTVIVGYDFAFGRGRGGYLEALEALARKLSVELVISKPFRLGGEVVSSSRIRKLCMQGEVELAAHLMGRPFFYRGIVAKGDGRGRTIGFPTANIAVGPKLLLPFGVYATHAVVGDSVFPSVTNIGLRPTFLSGRPGVKPLVETYVLDRELELYGMAIEVRFLSRIRAESKFDGMDSLRRQIQSDIEVARERLR